MSRAARPISMRDSEEIRFLDGTSQDTSAELAAARDQAHVEDSRRRVRWALGGLAWGVFVVPPACLLLAGAVPPPASALGIAVLAGSGVAALVVSLKRLLGK